jgi:serine/alanine racemase
MPFDKVDVDRVKNYCFKLFRLLGMWSVLLFFGGTNQLWYLGSTVVAITFLSLCLYHKVNFKAIVVIACLFYIIGLLGDSYYGLVAPLMEIPIFRRIINAYFYFFGTTRNGLFMGLIFVLIGASFACFDFNIKLSTAVVGTIISMICLFAEVFLLSHFSAPKDYNMYIFLVPAVFFIFSVFLRIQLKDHPIYQRLRNAGLLIYFSHLMIGNLCQIVADVLGLSSMDVAIYLSIPTLILTLLVAFWIEWLSHKKKFHWINWFLS